MRRPAVRADWSGRNDAADGERAGGLLGESLRSFLGLDRSPLRRPGEALVVRIATRMTSPDAKSRAQAQARLLQFYAVLRPKLDAIERKLEGDTT